MKLVNSRHRLVSLLLTLTLLAALLPVLSLGASAADVETIYSCGFETDEDMEGWLFTDGDGDGYQWARMNSEDDGIEGIPQGNYALYSYSYKNYYGDLTPDNWAYTPKITLPEGSELTLFYYVYAQDPLWWAEQYSVYVQTDDEMTRIHNETLTEGEDKENPAMRWLDLSDYAGKTVRIAFRHHDVSGQFAIAIDQVEIMRVLPREIGSVAVNVTAPAVNAAPDTTGTIPTGYSGYTVAKVSWEPADEVFASGKKYSVIVTLEAEKGYAFIDSVQTCINDNDATVIYKSAQQLKISYTFDALLPALPSMYFKDVKVSDWFYKDVEFVYYNHLMAGVGNNLFDPSGNCTRGMIVTVLYRLEGSPKVEKACPFSDVKSGMYYEAPITWAEANGVVMGVGGGKFAPEQKITREELATFLCRYAKLLGVYDEEDCVTLAGFSDIGKVSSWAMDSMSWAVGSGMIYGSNEADGIYLMPGGNAQRCQVAAILHRYVDTFVK